MSQAFCNCFPRRTSVFLKLVIPQPRILHKGTQYEGKAQKSCHAIKQELQLKLMVIRVKHGFETSQNLTSHTGVDSEIIVVLITSVFNFVALVANATLYQTLSPHLTLLTIKFIRHHCCATSLILRRPRSFGRGREAKGPAANDLGLLRIRLLSNTFKFVTYFKLLNANIIKSL